MQLYLRQHRAELKEPTCAQQRNSKQRGTAERGWDRNQLHPGDAAVLVYNMVGDACRDHDAINGG